MSNLISTKPIAGRTSEDLDLAATHDPFSSPHRRRQSLSDDPRIAALEIENSRLQRLVAELLIKNQQLRKPD